MRRLRGAGDVVAAAIKAVGVSPCGACERRAATWNHYLPLSLPAPVKPIIHPAETRHLLINGVGATGGWLWRMDQLASAAGAFNGRCVLAHSSDERGERVKAAFMSWFGGETLEASPGVSRDEAFPSLLEQFETAGESEAALYADVASATGEDYRVAAEVCAMGWRRTVKHLGTYAATGAVRVGGRPWRFSGAMFWLRLGESVYARNWRYLPRGERRVSRWPATMFTPSEATAALLDGMHQADVDRRDVDDALENWRKLYCLSPLDRSAR